MKILFACRNFHKMAGGVERMSSSIMNEMDNRGHKVFLITWDKSNAISHYQLNPGIKWIKLNIGNSNLKADWIMRIKRQLLIRKIVKDIKPSVAIGFQFGTFIALRSALLGFFIPTIAAERNSPDLFNFVENGRAKSFLASVGLLFSNLVTIQMESYKKKYPYYLRSRILTISNPVIPCRSPSYPNEKENTPKRILNVGRLSFQKNQLFLIKSFSLIAKDHPDWILTIVGEGEYRSQIENLIVKHNLSKRIELIGAVQDIDKWYRQSAFFVFPSLWEGFPNALAEAFRQGLPAIGLQNTSGVNELIHNQKNGLLVSMKEEKFALAMKNMIIKKSFRKDAGRYATNSIKKYQPKKIYNQWEDLFLNFSKKIKK